MDLAAEALGFIVPGLGAAAVVALTPQEGRDAPMDKCGRDALQAWLLLRFSLRDEMTGAVCSPVTVA